MGENFLRDGIPVFYFELVFHRTVRMFDRHGFSRGTARERNSNRRWRQPSEAPSDLACTRCPNHITGRTFHASPHIAESGGLLARIVGSQLVTCCVPKNIDAMVTWPLAHTPCKRHYTMYPPGGSTTRRQSYPPGAPYTNSHAPGTAPYFDDRSASCTNKTK